MDAYLGFVRFLLRRNDKLWYGLVGLLRRTASNYEPVGCEKCNAGYRGRAAIHEALYFTKEIKEIIVSSGSEVDENAIRQQAVKDGMWLLRRSGMERMLEGITTLEEVIATTTED